MEQTERGPSQGSDSVWEYSGMQMPPFLKQLQRILSEYPDGGQILKEIIQNADDADATEMKICYESSDTRLDPTRSWSRYFEAPALSFYNNAVFTEKDWEGLRAIYMSVKEEDLLKVGRFGLGFKSVFHISDFVTIISGHELLVIDALEVDPNKICSSSKLKTFSKFGSSFSALFGKFEFTEKSLTSGYFKGTMIWLPLRRRPSALSEDVYDETKVKDLLESFKAEANFTLLFLKSLERIEWFDGQKMAYCIQIKDSDEQFRNKRKHFLMEIKNSDGQPVHDIVSKWEMTVQTETCSNIGRRMEQKWLVVNLFGGQEAQTTRNARLLADKRLSYPPYVSIGVQLGMDTSQFKGHVFCFLPLPMESRSLTGFPVHVNGFFSLSQNRRHVKWSTVDEKANYSVSWNEFLVTELLPKVYNIVIQELISYSKHICDTSESIAQVYRSIPDQSCVQDNWQLLLKPLYSSILKENFLYTQTQNRHNSCWVDYKNCIFLPDPPVEEPTQKVIRRVYLEVGENLVEVPEHISAILKTHSPSGVKHISPDHLCGILQGSGPLCRGLSVSEKLYTLDFLLSDGEYGRLAGLELLPLENREFVAFKQKGKSDRKVFDCTTEVIRLFPGISKMFLMENFPCDIPVYVVERIREHLRKEAVKEQYQVQQMTPTDVAQMIRLTLKENSCKDVLGCRDIWWLTERFLFNDGWIDKIWQYMKTQFRNLDLFQNFPLILHKNHHSRGRRGLYKLSERMIVKKTRGTVGLSDLLCEALECLGVLVLPSLRASVEDHPGLLGKVVMTPSVHGVVQIISDCSVTDVRKFNIISTPQHRAALINYLHGVNELPSTAMCILRKMNLFSCTESIGTTPCFVSSQECGKIAPKIFPVKFPRPLLHLVTQSDKFLATLLGCTAINTKEIVEEILNTTCDSDHRKPFQSRTISWSNSEIERLVLFALDNADICNLLTEYKCIPCRPNRQLRYPKDLVDPNSQLAGLFDEEDSRFPMGDITFGGEGNKRLLTLKNIGMMHTSMPEYLTIQLAQSVERLAHNNPKKAKNKCVALLNYLGRENMWQTCQKLKDISFMPTMDKPLLWPLCWQGGSTVWAPPQSLFFPGVEYLVGSKCLVAGDLPLTMSDKRKLELFDNLGVTRGNEVPKASVLQQLIMISQVCYGGMKRQEKEVVGKICSSIYQYIDQISAEDDFVASDFKNLVNQPVLLLGEKFIHPSKTAYQKLQCDCTPELFCLADRDSVRKYKNFLKAVGVKQTFDPDDINNVLQQKKRKFGTGQLPKDELSLVINLVISLATVVEERKTLLPSRPIYMPDRTDVLHDVNDLCRDDCEFQVNKKKLRIVHSKIANNTAKLLGMKTLRHQHVKPHTRGLPFGQSEKLTDRLKRLLDSYPWGAEIMKELLQNADDGGATKLCLIKDFQHHPCEKLFDDSWKPLQGPALCVYNDSSFTKSDIEGIQKLGEGSKQSDPTKTGQYGVGFNAIYHLTDAPSFLTKGEAVDSGETLCVLDPHCRYVPGATVESPGKQYVDLEVLHEDYPDVFHCYPDKIFGNDSSGTLFRLPLRNEEMAEISQIKDEVVTECQVNELIEMFKDEMMESLLFLNNVTSIEIHNMSRTGIEQEYYVRAAISEESKMKKDNFFSDIKSVIQQIKDTELNICDIKTKQVTYRMNLCDNRGVCQTWCVVQQFGFPNGQELPQVVIKAVRTGDLGLFPRGGIALLLPEISEEQCSKNNKKGKSNNQNDKKEHSSAQMRGKAFCFLPLSQMTGLPVHVNGHFSLDHESRRHLWEDDSKSFRTLWNEALAENVIVECFISVLQELKSFLFAEHSIDLNLSEIRRRLDFFFGFFPVYEKVEGGYWKNLTKALYRQIDDGRIPFFPVIQLSQGRKEIGWVALKAVDGGHFPAFFNEKDFYLISPHIDSTNKAAKGKSEESFRQVLKRLGMKLIDSPGWLFKSMLSSDVKVTKLGADHIREFLKSFNQADISDHCNLQSVNVPVKNTVFRNVKTVCEILENCDKDGKLLDNLDGLPLLVTQDGILRVFRSDNTIFCSKFFHLISSTCKLELFVHENMVSQLSKLDSQYIFFKQFTVKEFASFLSVILDQSEYKSEGFIPWHPDRDTFSNRKWLASMWSFVLDYISIEQGKREKTIKESSGPVKDEKKEKTKKMTEEIRRQVIEDMLDILESWSLIPAHIGDKRILVPVCDSKTVLFFPSHSSKFYRILKTLNLPECDLDFKSNIRNLFSTIVADPRKTEDVLYCLSENRQMLVPLKLSCQEANQILQFFNNELEGLCEVVSEDTCRQRLKSLPFYETHCGKLTELTSAIGFTVPLEMPREGLDEWAKGSGFILLKEGSTLAPLYEFLKLSLKTTEEIYYNFIFKWFENLPENARFPHIDFLRTRYMDRYHVLTDAQRVLLNVMKNLSFVPVKNRGLLQVSDFFSPFEPVFQKIVSEDHFPPEPYCCEEWRGFMECLGMKTQKDITADMFVEFAKQVEQEGKFGITDGVEEKSKILVEHLFYSLDEVWNNPVLPRIAGICFLVPHKVNEDYAGIHSQKDHARKLISFSDSVPHQKRKLAWTTQTILTSTNDPTYISKMREEDKQKMQKELGICVSPEVDNVVSHIQNVCDSLKTVLASCDGRETEQLHVVNEIVECFYEYLQDNLEIFQDVIMQRLKHTPIIFLQEDCSIVPAYYAIQQLAENQEIKPYLVKAPDCYGKFFKLFECLGTEEKPTENHFATVLSALYTDTSGEKLHPNELKTMCRAMQNFFELSSRNGSENRLTVPNFYLPTEEERLVLSTQLIFSDNEHLKKRISSQIKLSFFIGFDKLEICPPLNIKEIIPNEYMPRMLSSITREYMIDRPSDSGICISHRANVLKNLLHSAEFFGAVIRLIEHQKDDGTEIGKEDEELIRHRLQNTRIVEVPVIKTELAIDDVHVPDSCEELQFFIDTEDINKYVLYVSERQDYDFTEWISNLRSELVQLLSQCICLSLKDSEIYLGDIFTIYIDKPEKISEYLDKKEIKSRGAAVKSFESLFPPPGTRVPPEFYDYLDNNFHTFSQGEYVALEMFDHEIDEHSEDTECLKDYYKYAKIIGKRRKDENDENETDESCKYLGTLLQKYELDIGYGHIEAESLEIYKFHRNKSSTSTEIISVETVPLPQSNQPLDQLKQNIKQLLKQSWSLREDQKRRIIKRLILKWHPDKNLGNEEHCKEIFIFIKNIMSRLENNENPDEDEIDGAMRHQRAYSDFGDSIFQRGTSSTRHTGGNFNEHYREEVQTDPWETRRWMRQAKCDLEAARRMIHTTDGSHFNWVCYMCQQGAEKMLKAAWYNKDSRHLTEARSIDQSHVFLPTIANGLGKDLEDLVKTLQDLTGPHTRMIYPDSQTVHKIPSDLYTQAMAAQACGLAQNMADLVLKYYI